VDAAVRENLGAGTDSGGYDEITIARIDSLTRPHGLLLNHRRNVQFGIHRFRRNSLHGLDGSDRIVRRSKCRQYRKVDGVCECFNFRRSARQSDREHSRSSHRFEDCLDLLCLRRFLEIA